MIDPTGLLSALLFALALGLGTAAECQPAVDKPAPPKPAPQPPPTRLPTDTFARSAPVAPSKSLPVGPKLGSTAAVPTAPIAAAGPPRDLGALWLQNQFLAREVNAARAANGLRPLAIDDRLAAAAFDQAGACYRLGGLTHTGSDGSNIGDRLTRHGVRWRGAGENIDLVLSAGGSILPPDPARIAPSARQAVSDWMTADPWHRANVLGDWTAMGCAAVPATGRWATNGGGGTFWVVDFAR